MRILLTGQVGLGKSAILEQVVKLAASKGMNVGYTSVGAEMVSKHAPRVAETSILNLPKRELDLLRRCVWDLLLAKLGKPKPNGNDVHIVNTHAVFRWHHGLMPALDLDQLAEFAPDAVFVLVDKSIAVKKGLIERGTDIFEFWELFAWREEEIWFSIFVADSLARILGKPVPCFVVPKAQCPALILKLIAAPKAPKVYISFPMTGASEPLKRKIGKFKEKIHEQFIAFDPEGIKDRELRATYKTVEGEIAEHMKPVLDKLESLPKPRGAGWEPYRDRWTPLSLVKMKVDLAELRGAELASVLEAIDSQIVSRDYLLIDQSDFVLMYITVDKEGGPRISAGCQAELTYAFHSGKKVYVVFPGEEDKLSPWVTQFSRCFSSLEKAFDFLTKEHAK